jgi:hypothetical protein
VHASDGAALGKHLRELLLVKILGRQVLNVAVRESGALPTGTLRLALEEDADYSIFADGLTVGLGNGLGGILLVLEMDKTVSERLTFLPRAGRLSSRNLARQDISEDGKSVVQSLVVNVLGDVLDKDVALAGLAEGGVTVAPHDAATSSTDKSEVLGVKRVLSILNAVEVDVCVAKGAASCMVTAHTDRCDRADAVKDLEEKSLVDLRVQVTNVQRCGR